MNYLNRIWRNSILHRLTALVFVATLVPATVLVGNSLILNTRARQQMERGVEETLDLAITLEQSLLDSRLTRMKDRAVSLAATPLLIAGLGSGTDVTALVERGREASPGADLVAVVDLTGAVRARAGTPSKSDRLSYGGLVPLVIDSATAEAAVERIPKEELRHEAGPVLAQVRLPISPTEASSDPRVGTVLEDALALVGVAPVLDEGGRVIGAVIVADILNNDHLIVDEVTSRSPRGLPIHATIALDGIRVTTSVPAPGGGRRAVGLLYSDLVMARLRAGQEYRGRALVGGWQWERTIYLPVADHAGRVVAGTFVGVPEANFAALTSWTTVAARIAVGVTVASLAGAVFLARRLARRSIVQPLERFTAVLSEGDLHTRIVMEEHEEAARLAEALNGMTERIRHTVAEVAGVAEGVRAVSERLAAEARQTSADAWQALEVAGSALSAAEQVSGGAHRAAGRMRELELAIARIDAGTEEQARAVQHAGAAVTQVTGSMHESRQALAAVLESTRAAVAAAQQGRHSALRAVAALELVRLAAEADGEDAGAQRAARLPEDLERGVAAADACDAALKEIAREADAARSQLWELAAALNESGARAGAVASQLTDISAVVDETAANSRAMGAASREIIGQVESMAAGTESALGLVQQARSHVTSIAGANRRLLDLSERIAALARELDAVTSRFPRR